MASLADVFRVLNELEAAGVVERYAVGGAMAMLFWAEPVVTFDLDVFVHLPETSSPVLSLEPLYTALRERGFDAQAEHVLIHGTPVQFLPSPNELSDEALETSVTRDLEGVAFRVIRQAPDPPPQARCKTVMARRANRTRPTPEFLETQARAKARWRREMAARPLREKIELLLEMQRRLHPILQRRRALQWWERPWEIEP